MVDWKLIRELEGFELQGYVPDPDNSNSGVTIASGFDLGQRKAHALHRMGLDHLVPIFRPYFGLKGRQAYEFLKANPLRISHEDADALNRAAHERTLELVRSWWAQSGCVPWTVLSVAQKTVLASVAFQYGNLPRRTPTFWRLATTGDWAGVIAELRDFGDRYTTRRRKEAKYLEDNS